jgi:hypothetical protein
MKVTISRIRAINSLIISENVNHTVRVYRDISHSVKVIIIEQPSIEDFLILTDRVAIKGPEAFFSSGD